MKKLFFLTGAFAVFMLMAFTGNMHTTTFKVDPKQSTLQWHAEKLTGKHHGTLEFSGGEMTNNHGTMAGTFEIDMTTIQNKDLEDEAKRTKLENHLKSEDFFDTKKFPKSKFVTTSVVPVKVPKAGGNTHTITGMLTIKDKTNEISFDAQVFMGNDKAFCIGSAVIDRSKFDVKYGSKTFFEDIGDKVIYDEFTLKFNVLAFPSH